MVLSSVICRLAIRSSGSKLVKTCRDQTVGNTAPAGMSVGRNICIGDLRQGAMFASNR